MQVREDAVHRAVRLVDERVVVDVQHVVRTEVLARPPPVLLPHALVVVEPAHELRDVERDRLGQVALDARLVARGAEVLAPRGVLARRAHPFDGALVLVRGDVHVEAGGALEEDELEAVLPQEGAEPLGAVARRVELQVEAALEVEPLEPLHPLGAAEPRAVAPPRRATRRHGGELPECPPRGLPVGVHAVARRLAHDLRPGVHVRVLLEHRLEPRRARAREGDDDEARGGPAHARRPRGARREVDHRRDAGEREGLPRVVPRARAPEQPAAHGRHAARRRGERVEARLRQLQEEQLARVAPEDLAHRAVVERLH